MPLNSQVPGWLKTPGYHLPSGLVVTTLGSMPLGQLLQHCGHPVGTLRKGGYVTPAMGCEPLSPRPAAGLCKHRKRLEKLPETQRSHKTKRCSCWPSFLAQEAHAPPPPPPACSNADSCPQTPSVDSDEDMESAFSVSTVMLSLCVLFFGKIKPLEGS